MASPNAEVSPWSRTRLVRHPQPSIPPGKSAEPQRLQRGTEVLPGYTLVEPLGGGSSGVVWKATSPGGLVKAVKIVHGDLRTLHGSDIQVELQALERVSRLRHPFVLSLERFDIVRDQLVIVTELADGSLWDCFVACRALGGCGIPRAELLRYLAEVAEALDFLCEEHHLQHLDIKPQNLLLFGNHVKVGDFGLVQDLEALPLTLTVRSTPAYAPPELQEGHLSRFSDQYSLAITYAELLTGLRPFTSNSRWQLLLQHAQSPPSLDALPSEDRAPVARALSKGPGERFESCLEFVEALQSARPCPTAPPVRMSPTMPEPAAATPTLDDPPGSALRTPRNGSPAPAFLGARLLDDLQHPDVEVCRRALLALRRLGPEARSALGVCAALLYHPDGTIRWETLQVVEQLGAEARPIQADLAGVLNDPRDFIRVKAAELLWRLDERTAPEILAQLRAVVATRTSDCLLALQALERMGPVAQVAASTIQEALQGWLQGVARRQALRTLEAITPAK